ncbi:hypothetical protein PV325_002115 [Microctonus aethiopoides]|nr:hypothetical protein PV325_002115 [Microctonus aethiopoides]KAK0098407.1 hypothetical protein PV326_008682 [Microctonus aethiopoides]
MSWLTPIHSIICEIGVIHDRRTNINCEREQGQNTSKKKTTFSRLLRGLKTHRKEKQGQSHGSPRHGRARMGVPQRLERAFDDEWMDSGSSDSDGSDGGQWW